MCLVSYPPFSHAVAILMLVLPNDWVEGSQCSPPVSNDDTAQLISIVEMCGFRPTFLCGILQPFLSHADSKYAECRTMDHASKSCLELQPRIGSYAGSGVHISSTDAPEPSSKTSNWSHDGIEIFSLFLSESESETCMPKQAA